MEQRGLSCCCAEAEGVVAFLPVPSRRCGGDRVVGLVGDVGCCFSRSRSPGVRSQSKGSGGGREGGGGRAVCHCAATEGISKEGAGGAGDPTCRSPSPSGSQSLASDSSVRESSSSCCCSFECSPLFLFTALSIRRLSATKSIRPLCDSTAIQPTPSIAWLQSIGSISTIEKMACTSISQDATFVYPSSDKNTIVVLIMVLKRNKASPAREEKGRNAMASTHWASPNAAMTRATALQSDPGHPSAKAAGRAAPTSIRKKYVQWQRYPSKSIP